MIGFVEAVGRAWYWPFARPDVVSGQGFVGGTGPQPHHVPVGWRLKGLDVLADPRGLLLGAVDRGQQGTRVLLDVLEVLPFLALRVFR